MRRLFSFLLFIFTVVSSYSQKKPLDHSVYDSWKSIYNAAISPNGNFITYEINPQEGDGVLHLFTDGTYDRKEFSRGKNAQINPNSEYIVFKILPQHDTIRRMKIEKKKKDDFPKDSLGIYLIRANTTQKVANLLSFKLPAEKSDWMAYLVEEKRTPEVKKVKKTWKFWKKKSVDPAPKPEKVNVLYFTNPLSGEIKSVDHGADYVWSENGELLAIVKQKKNKDKEPDSCYVLGFDIRTNKLHTIMAGKGVMKNITTDRMGNQLAFVFSADTSDRKLFKLYRWSVNEKELKMISDTAHASLPNNWTISGEYKLQFSYDGNRLFLGTCPKPLQKAKDTLPGDEKVILDIWHWNDPLIQPEQVKKLKETATKSYLAVYHIAHDNLIQLATEEVDNISLPYFSNNRFAMGRGGKPYEQLITWEGWYNDIYVVDIETGAKTKILDKHAYRPHFSPNGSHVVYFKDSLWHSYHTQNATHQLISKGINFPLYEEDHDVPSHAQPYRFGGFTNDSSGAIFSDKYDLWWVDLNGEREGLNLTNGREEKWIYMVVNSGSKDPYLPSYDPMLISAQNEKTKKHRYGYLKEVKSPGIKVVREEAEMLVEIKKAEHSDKIIYRSSTFNRYPEIVLTNIDFSPLSLVTSTNPQQKEYYWGTVELVEWKTDKGETLQGLLYLPENKGEMSSLPFLVYFYEKYSHTIHRHYVPAPSASIINPAEYVSRGYAVFIPDIVYNTGEPAQSAYRCIMSGTDYVLSKYSFIDETRMGIQGQSWGGYQTAMLVTMTNRFKAAMAGAPVSNMTSAYGGVRWGSGLSRMFQYERGQSRLGKTLWEDKEVFLKNSPLFYLDKVKTPLLIMHNDQDGAVPWYQGIELYMGLRRLRQPAWMLNYNNEDHNLMKRHNRKDLSIRMQQFFDYYLMNKELPEWMEEGRPAIDRETKTAY